MRERAKREKRRNEHTRITRDREQRVTGNPNKGYEQKGAGERETMHR